MTALSYPMERRLRRAAARRAEPLMVLAARCRDDGTCPSLRATARRAEHAAKVGDHEVEAWLRSLVTTGHCRCAHEALHARLMRGEGMPG